MPNFIVISSKKKSDFDSEAKTVLESHKFSEINPGTYMGSASANPLNAATDLKKLEAYKKNHSTAGIKIYHGTLTS